MTNSAASDEARGLRLIGAFKLFKAAALLAVALGLLSLSRHDSGTVADIITRFRDDSHNHWIHGLLARLLGVDRHTLHLLDVGSFIYAGVFMVEGIGLLLRQRWAEYMTLGVTLSFIPLEVYELAHHPSLVKAAAIAINLVIAGYLVYELRPERAARRRAMLSQAPPVPRGSRHPPSFAMPQRSRRPSGRGPGV